MRLRRLAGFALFKLTSGVFKFNTRLRWLAFWLMDMDEMIQLEKELSKIAKEVGGRA